MLDATEISFDDVIKALLNEANPFPAKYLYRLSDITRQEQTSLEKAWPRVSLQRRQALMEDIQSMGEDDFLLDFSALGGLALQDADSYVRLLGVRTLTEYEEVALMPTFMRMAEHDSDEQVRAASAAALGPFVYMGEVEELSEKKLRQVEECLLRLQRDDDPLVRRRSLESLGFSSREEVPALIESAYNQGEREWLVSALLAMGRSSNSQWNSRVIDMLEDRRADVRTEAATAAGELCIKSCYRRLMELLEDPHDQVRAAAIWALSEIGGEGVWERLEAMQEDTEDEDEADLIEAALDNLAFTEDFQDFSMLKLSEEEGEEEEIANEEFFEDEEDEFDESFDEDEDLEEDEDEEENI